MIVGFHENLPVAFGFILKVEETCFEIAVYRPWTEGFDPEEVKIAGNTIHRDLKGLSLAVSSPLRVALEDLRFRAEFSDHAMWGWPVNHNLLNSPFGLPFNRFVETYVSKRLTEDGLRNQENVPVKLFVPFRGSKFSDCAIHLTIHPDLPLVTNVAAMSVPFADLVVDALPKLKIDPTRLEIAAGEFGKAFVQTVDGRGTPLPVATDVHLEEIGGYLPLRRISLVNGQGTIRVGALGLEPGESFKVKAGFRHFSGMADLIVKVV